MMLSFSLKFFFSSLAHIELSPISLSNALTASVITAAQCMPLYRYLRVHLRELFGSDLDCFQF